MFFVKSASGKYAGENGVANEKKDAVGFKTKKEAEDHLGRVWTKLPLDGHWGAVKEESLPETLLPVSTRFQKWIHEQNVTQSDLIMLQLNLCDILIAKNPSLQKRIKFIQEHLHKISE